MKRSIATRFSTCLLAACILLLGARLAGAQGDPCKQPEPVCATRAAVFAISAFDPVGSAVRIGPDRLVTTRHSVADAITVRLFLADQTPTEAKVIPSDYPGDLILLESEALPDGPVLSPSGIEPGAALFTVGADVGQQRIRAYDPGKLRFEPPVDLPLARLHHDAYSQPGNSGGALVDAEGRLIGIVASGGEGRYEAIPATAIAALDARSGPSFAAASAEIGGAVRVCVTLQDALLGSRQRMAEEQAQALETSCRRSGNRQLTDLAAQRLGQEGRSDVATALFEHGLAEDPNGINTRLGLVVTQHLARDFEAALPHLHWLMEAASDDLQVLRLAIQAGTWAGDDALAQRALVRLKEINPQAAPAAERFLANPPPRPPKPQ